MSEEETQKKSPFVVVDGVLKGSLKHGFIVKGQPQKDFELRDVTVGDMLDAEVDAKGELAFKANLLALQLQRVGDFNGPFTVGMIRKLRPTDFAILRAAQLEMQLLGEDGAAPDAAG